MYSHPPPVNGGENLQHFSHVPPQQTPQPSPHQQQQQQQQQHHHHHQSQPPLAPPLLQPQHSSTHNQHQQQQQGSMYPPTAGLPSMHTAMSAPPPMQQYQYGSHASHYAMPPPLAGPSSSAPIPSNNASSMTLEQNNIVGNDGRYKFRLIVEQQPQRARMCGFGDKDRRPITPPPCIRLEVTDLHTDKLVDLADVDGSFFVLQVDLWDHMAQREVNIVRASSASPAVSISTATTTSYPPTPERPMPGNFAPHHPQPVMYTGHNGPMMVNPGYPSVHHRASLGGSMADYSQPFGYPPQSYDPTTGQSLPYHPVPVGGSSQHGSQFTRNLIGSLTVNASKLKDTEGKDGFWFVLQDLSVRTEGHFRLKLNFIDLGSNGTLNRGRSDVISTVFSDTFQVYSAKKFPGVIESTSLSKCFAAQGIKIPIRKDVKSELEREDDE